MSTAHESISPALQTALPAPPPPAFLHKPSEPGCCLPPLTCPPFSWLKSYSLDFPSCTECIEQEVIFFSDFLRFLPSFSSWRDFVDRFVPSAFYLAPVCLLCGNLGVARTVSAQDSAASLGPCARCSQGFGPPVVGRVVLPYAGGWLAPFPQQESWLESDQTDI